VSSSEASSAAARRAVRARRWALLTHFRHRLCASRLEPHRLQSTMFSIGLSHLPDIRIRLTEREVRRFGTAKTRPSHSHTSPAGPGPASAPSRSHCSGLKCAADCAYPSAHPPASTICADSVSPVSHHCRFKAQSHPHAHTHARTHTHTHTHTHARTHTRTHARTHSLWPDDGAKYFSHHEFLTPLITHPNTDPSLTNLIPLTQSTHTPPFGGVWCGSGDDRSGSEKRIGVGVGEGEGEGGRGRGG
jgi:hypothetical protein